MKPKTFYRVCNPESEQGLWYDFKGKFTGLIHNKFNFCVNSNLQMPFDDELVGWLSATDTLESLWNWFTVDDILKLQKHGWFIHEYEVDTYRFYDKFQHYVICQKTSKIIRKIPLLYTIICLHCKTRSFHPTGETFIPCNICSPNHPTFHQKINL